ncbi:glycoside hydrolase family 78 protein [Lachnospiraceae bacterium OttesenSCG-928-D06]|nr:glycoside hydrolase family 78 protein [Lachnospiraceae bacterium OttesenSCG-928-D06]
MEISNLTCQIEKLTCENRKNPLCIDVKNPVFGWNIKSSLKGVYQKAYQIKVWKENKENLVWDSGVVSSNVMCNIPYEGKELLSGSRYLWWVEVHIITEEIGEESAESASDWFETGFLKETDWKGEFIGETQDFSYHLFRKSFSCEKKIQKAKLYICGLGHFVCYINGTPVSDNVLEGGWTNYDKSCLYTAYDVSQLLSFGDNAVLVKLGDGMYNVPGGRYVYYPRSYGKMKLLIQLEIVYEDGSSEVIVTDKSWKMTKSPITFCCIYGGEDFDGRLWKEGFLKPDYKEDDTWENAVVVDPPLGTIMGMKTEPIKVMENIKPISIKESRPGVWLYDLGTNFSGWVRIRLRTDKKQWGEKVVMTPCELLLEDGRVNQKVTGEGYQWTYTLNDEEVQEFAPEFTYTGFRYVEIKGAVPLFADMAEASQDAMGRKIPVIEFLQGEFIYTAVEKAGEFACSNSLFNQIHQIILQAIKSNMKSYLTDCPHREKLPWMEESHLIGPSIMYNFNMRSLYEKIEMDMADAQRESGLIPDICPEYVTGFDQYHKGFVDSPEWGSACIINPWYVYKRYGDTSLMKRFYDVMKKYLNYLKGMTYHEMLHHGLGDWLDIGPCMPHSQNTPVPIVASCIYYYDLNIMKQTADLLGYEADSLYYAGCMEKVFKEYNLQYLDDQTARYGTGSQAAQAMSLIVGLVPEAYEEKVVEELRQDIIKRNYAITAGDIGHPFLIAAMKKYNMSDLLAKMTNITETPGYGYQVVNGATTLTENWDGSNPQNPQGSQNHLMLGSIEEWFYGGLGGMELVRNDLPFGTVKIMPHIAEGIDYVDTWVLHPYGKIAVKWQRKEEKAEVTVQVPPNVKAYLMDTKGKVYQEVGSGCYSYTIE